MNKILSQNRENWQIVTASAGLFAGFFLLLGSIQLFFDVNHILSGEKNRDQYLVINKKVNILNTIGLKASFSEKEIAEISERTFVQEVFPFTSNQFKVSASSRTLGFYTELFFESVPDDCLDVKSASWEWEEGQRELPILLSRDYLALYNFGFAPSQGLPQFTPSTIQKVTLDINIGSGANQRTFIGRIAGFSDRFNSILVPADFMEWANRNYGRGEEQPARLVLQVTNPESVELKTFLEENNYETGSGQFYGSHLASLFNLTLVGVGVLATILLFLAFLIYRLNFQLVIRTAILQIRLLLQIGYSQKEIRAVLQKQLLHQVLGVFFITLLSLGVCRFLQIRWLDSQGLSTGSWVHPVTILTTLLLATGFIYMNFNNIRKYIQQAS